MSTLLTASILLLLLWPAYALLLRYSDRYALNRFLLVLAMVAIVALPFVSFDSPAPLVTQGLQGTIEYLEQTAYQSLAAVPEYGVLFANNDATQSYGPVAVERAVTEVQTATFIYLGGVGVMLALFMGRLFFLLVLHLRSQLDDRAGYRLLHKEAAGGQAFTFGSNVYFSEDVPNDPDFDHILTHERVHARQLHTVDILLAEVFLCLFWFHPAAWWLRTQMRANLEYLVDKAVVNQGADRRSYQIALVRQSAAAQGLALALPFSEPSLKSRIARMTGLPEYRVIGILAAVALTFWLGVAMVVVNGNSDDRNNLLDLLEENTSTSMSFGDVTVDEFGNAVASENDIYLQELLKDETQASVAGIKSFSLYIRRLPTPYEFAQIQQMLGALDHTQFSIYQPCNAEEGTYKLQLSHWLNVEARLNFTLQEGELLDHHYVIKLEPNGAFNLVPKTPHVTGGYFTPKVYATVFDKNEPMAAHSSSQNLSLFDNNVDNADAGKLKPGQHKLADYRDDLANEEIAVIINGERRPLKHQHPVSLRINGTDSDKVTDIRVNGQPVPTWSQSYFANWKEVIAKNGPPPTPASERMGCLLGMGGSRWGLVRNVFDYHTGSCRTWFERLDLPENREILYYYNDELSTAAKVLDREFKYVEAQVGYDRNDPNGKIIVQAIDDLYWFVTPVE